MEVAIKIMSLEFFQENLTCDLQTVIISMAKNIREVLENKEMCQFLNVNTHHK